MVEKKRRKLKIFGSIAIILVTTYFLANKYLEVTDTWTPHLFWYGESIQERKVSPDGRFEATTVYLDGFTYGIQFVRLRDLRNPIIHYAHKVAISNFEEIKHLEWTSSNELHIVAAPGQGEKNDAESLFEVHESTCYGIKISYGLERIK